MRFPKFIHFAILSIIILSAGAHAQIATLVLREKDGTASTNYPLTFAHVFGKGQVSAAQNLTLSIGGQIIPTQYNVKRHYDDGSVRHAVFSAIIPQVTANNDMTINIVTGGTNQDTGEMTKAQILALDVQSVIDLTGLSGCGYSGSLTADLRQALTDASTLTYWLKGSVMTEVIVPQTLNSSLKALWELRIYPTVNIIRISNTIENVDADYRGNIQYSVDIRYGSALTNVYHKEAFTHNCCARWRKVIWHTGEPAETEIRYDVAYLKQTGHILNYDPDITISEARIAQTHTNWLSRNNDIMGSSVIETYFPTTGGRGDIGPLTTWTMYYLYTMDNRMRDLILNLGELSGSTPVHYRESNAGKSFHGHIVSIDDRPTAWFSRNDDFQYINAADRFAPALGSMSTEWSIDRAHQPSLVYIPYLITGEYYFLHELYYWAAYNLGNCNYNADWGRNYSMGLIRDQVRGEAWAIRNMADAAALAPDGDVEKTYIETKLQNNLDQWLQEYVYNADSHPLHTWGYISGWGEDGGRPDDNLIGCEHSRTGKGSGINEHIYPIRHMTSSWMDNFMVCCLKHLVELDFSDAAPIHAWVGAYTLNSLSHPETNPFNGTNYHLPATWALNVTQASPYYPVASWQQLDESLNSQSTVFDSDDANGYEYIALGTLGTLAELQIAQHFSNGAFGRTVSGQMVYDWMYALKSRTPLFGDPKWAIVPRTTGPREFSVSFKAGARSGAAPLSVSFTHSTLGGTAVSWAWDFDNNGTIDSNEPNPAFVYATPGIYTVALQVSDGINQSTMTAANYITVTEPGQVTEITVKAKLFLEGAFNGSDAMRQSLYAAGVIPQDSPYNVPAHCDAIPAAAVDWVKIVLRSSPLASSGVDSASCLVDVNGNLIDTNGDAGVSFMLETGNYYIVIYHRNHFSIMSANAVALDGSVYDFTTGSNKYYGSNGYKDINSVHCMWAGDMNQDKLISIVDYNLWLASAQAGASGYLTTDINMDGYVTTADYVLAYNNSLYQIGANRGRTKLTLYNQIF